ncbi:glycosyltransferase family 61 protein [bacterium]|nr:glycosyltransferase family 61 protein [bacterium]
MLSIDYRYLRPKKAEALKAWYDAPVEVRENPEIWQGSNATILPLRRDDQLLFGRGGVVDSDGNYVDLSAIPGRVQYAYPFENAEYRDETVVYCGYLVNHWGHFLIEGVTRLWYFLENDRRVDKYVFFLDEHEEREIKGNYREFLELLKIWDRLEIINRPTTYREVIVPELGIHMRTAYTPKLVKVFDAAADSVVPDPGWETPEKIYFSRSQFQKGLPFESGYDTLDNFFAKNGYTILYPEKVPLSRMIHYIRNAKVVASLSGSLPHNMLFANQGQRVEIVERLVISDDNQTDVNRMRQLQVTYIDASIPIYPVDFVGPLIMGYTDCLKRFAEDKGYAPPDGQYLTEKHDRRCFVKYMKAYVDLYNCNWFMADWYAPFADSLYEGFQAGQAHFGAYLNRKKPYRWYHYFEFHYWKQFVKRLLNK